MALIWILAAMVVLSVTMPQPLSGLPPALNNRREHALAHERFRRGFVTDDSIENENVDQTTLRRNEDHFVNDQSDSYKIKSNNGFLGDGELYSDTKALQLDRQKQIIDRRNIENDHLGVRRNAANLKTVQHETGSRHGRNGYRAALGGPIHASDYAYDMAEFNRIDNERVGRDTDYAKDADRTLIQYDRGVAERSAEAGALIAQDGGIGAGSDGFELGSAKTEREMGMLASETLMERGGALNEINRGHDAVGRVRAKRASTAFGPDGAVAADVIANQDSWDRGKLNHRDQVRFLHRAHNTFADVGKERSKSDVDLKVTIAQGSPGDISCGDRIGRSADARDRMIERDTRDRIITNAETETTRTFDIGGRTVVDGNGQGIGIPQMY